MKARVVQLSDIARHPTGSLSPRDYLFDVGETVVYQGQEHLVVRQDENDLWLAAVEHVPGTRVVFSCTVPLGPTATIFEVKRPKGRR